MVEDLEFFKAGRVDPSFPSVTERYFKPKFFSDDSECVLVHSNRLCVVALSPHHPIVAEKKTVSSVNFEILGKVNRLKNKVSGKFKRGGQKLKSSSTLCAATCSDGSEYIFTSCVNGTLVEVNERLLQQPTLLAEKPWSDGYIAIILPPFETLKQPR